MALEELVDLAGVHTGEGALRHGGQQVVLARAAGQALPSQVSASSGGGWRQQVGSSGQPDFDREGVSRPRNHFTWSKGTPMLSE